MRWLKRSDRERGRWLRSDVDRNEKLINRIKADALNGGSALLNDWISVTYLDALCRPR